MKKEIILIILLLFVFASFRAQNPYKGTIDVVFEPCELVSDQLNVRSNIDLSGLKLNYNDMIVFSPKLVSLDGQHEKVFESVVISGKRRTKVLLREMAFDAKAPEISPENFHMITRKSRLRNIPLEYSVPFEKWMRHSRLIITEQTFGCYRCRNKRLYADGRNIKQHEGEAYLFPEPYQPVYKVMYITPPVEEVKIMSETYSAQLQFPVNKFDLQESFGNNRRVLAEVDDIIRRLRTDSLLTIRRISVRGYASPEGSTANNVRLSQGRAQAFVAYLHGKHHFYEADKFISSHGMGEDWEGLKKKVADSDMNDRYKILDIIDNHPNPERRKVLIKGLSGGMTYRSLLEQVYPMLRRNEYTVEYEVRGFNVQEAQALIATRPQLLSLNEMFMVANRYAHGTDEFSGIFDVAVRLYPESPVAQLNVAASEIEKGAYDAAIARLSKMESPEAWNNLAIAYWHTGQSEKALELFRKAAATGNTEAQFNVEEYHKWDNDRDK